MKAIEAFKNELEKEAVTTRKMLSIVPADKFDWKPHEKSMTLKNLASHIAELPTWIGLVFTTNELDFSVNPYKPKVLNSNSDLMVLFEESLEDARKSLDSAKEESLTELWTLRDGETIYNTDPKWDVVRMSLSQVIHHRAQLGVYLRLLNIAIPGSYGPSADDMKF